MTLSIQDSIQAVAQLSERVNLVRSPFHLSSCGGCGGPSFQQPCSLCAFYPRGSDKGTWFPKEATSEFFCHSIDRSGIDRKDGNLATWYMRSLEKVVLYKAPPNETHPALKPWLVIAQAMTDLAPPSEIYEAVSVRKERFTRPYLAFAAPWDALTESRLLLENYRHPDPALMARQKQAMAAVVDAVHAEDQGALASAAEDLHEVLSRLYQTGALNMSGNLRIALDATRKVADDKPNAPSP